MIVIFAGELKEIAELYNFGAMLSFALAHLSLLSLCLRKPNLERPFKAKFNVRFGKVEILLTAVLGLLGTTAVWVDVIITKLAGRNFGIARMALGLTSYLWHRHKQKLSPTARLNIKKLDISGYKPVKVRKILVPVANTSHSDTMQFAVNLAKQHAAEVTALHVMEIPHSLPLDTFFPEKLAYADSVTEQAEAVAHEYDILIEAQIKQSRSAGEMIVEMAKQGNFDLIIMGTRPAPQAPGRGVLSTTVDHVLRNAPGRVWFLSRKGEAFQ